MQADGTLRSVQLRSGVQPQLQNPMSYSRPHTFKTFKAPFEFTGRVRVLDRAVDGAITIFGENRVPGWTHGVCVAPVWVDEDNNLMDCVKPNYTKHGASGQINGVYGIPFESRFNGTILQHDYFMDGQWHEFRIEVPKAGHHRLFWDDMLMVELLRSRRLQRSGLVRCGWNSGWIFMIMN